MLEDLRRLQKTEKHPKTVFAILTEKTDRLYRNFKDYVMIDDLDLEIHLVTENVVISKHSQSSVKFIHSVKVLMAKNFIDNLSEEVRKGMNEKATQGHYPSRAPVGYRNVRRGGKSVMEIDPIAAPVIRGIFEWYTSDCPSLQQVKARIDQKLLTGDITLDYKFSTSNLHRILRNTIYYGDFFWHGVRYHGTHEPIITKEMFLRAQEVSDTNRRKTRKKHTARWAFQGLVRCAECGGIMSADKKKKRYVYYHCSGRVKPCRSRAYVREELLNEAFEEILGAVQLPEELVVRFKNSLESTSQERDEIKATRLHELQTELALLTKRLDLLYRDRLDRVITTEAYKTYKAEIERQCDGIESEILIASEMNGEALRGGIAILELLGTLAQWFQTAEASEKRLCLVATLSNSEWKDGHLQVMYRQPLDAIALAVIEAKKKIGKSLSKSADYPVWCAQRDSNPCFQRERLTT